MLKAASVYRILRGSGCGARSCFQRFINPANGGLFDVLDGSDGNVDALRLTKFLLFEKE
jgi:hypothetical protein